MRWLLIGLAAVGFLAVSAVLTFLLRPNVDERDAVAALVRAQARGDVPAMLSAMPACSRQPPCLDQARRNAGALRATGAVQVLAFTPSSTLSLGGGIGLARIAWRAGPRTVVQCARVRRSGGPLGGRSITLLGLSGPIDPTGDCR